MNYEDFLTNEVFPLVKGKSVLELGALNFRITDCIKNAGASHVETVDPFGKTTFRGTANDYYNTTVDKFDVVTCMGLLYHLHSPFHLLELIINKSEPDTLIVETGPTVLIGGNGIGEELFSTVGNAWPDKGIKHPLKIHLAAGKDDFVRAIETTPMKLDKYWDYKDVLGNHTEFTFRLERDENRMPGKNEKMWLGVFNREE